jgi:hypothetical protein
LACLATAVGCLVVCVASSFAQTNGLVTIDARRCADIESPNERLACFEAQVDEAAKQPASPATSTAGATQSTASAPPATTQVESARVQPRQTREQTEWVGSIASLRERIPYRYLITLDTGQVWEQAVNGRFALRVGQRVRIYRTRWGSHYRLEAEGLNGFIQVDLVE